ncbi:TPA: hypothetical protein ACS727_003670 [Providencia alcalifaciens]|uniref:hypothetical protein n=1 Tax=Providencia alcalifaciens TaxID=126385 RepID=UPI0032DA5F2F
MEFKGSKSPWHIGSHPFEYRNRHAIWSDDNTVIAHILQPGDTESAALAQADTRLIAAAPELLEALQRLLKYHDDFYGIEPDEDPDHPLAVAKAAIAKALGQQ